MELSLKLRFWALLFTIAWVCPIVAQRVPRVIRKTSDQLSQRIIKWQEPVFPAIARQVGAGGPVVVELIVDEQGKVASAQVVSGHPLLRAALLQAARTWKFKPGMSNGAPVRLTGRITYTYPSSDELFEGKHLRELEKQTREKPGSAEAHYQLGAAYSKQNRDDEALSQLSKAIRIDPLLVDAHLKLGHIYMKLAQLHAEPANFEMALDAFSAAVRLKPESSEALHALGLANMATGNYEGAIEAFKRSLEVEGPITSSHFALGKCYVLLNRPDEAVGHYKRGLSKHPDSDSGHYGLGEAYFILERYVEAINELKESIKLSMGPGRPQAHLYLGLAFLRRGNGEAALKEYEILKTLDAELASQLIEEIRKSGKRNSIS